MNSAQAWVRYAKFEMQNGEVALARKCYERAVEELGDDANHVSEVTLGSLGILKSIGVMLHLTTCRWMMHR
jgi:hypothetical protein